MVDEAERPRGLSAETAAILSRGPFSEIASLFSEGGSDLLNRSSPKELFELSIRLVRALFRLAEHYGARISVSDVQAVAEKTHGEARSSSEIHKASSRWKGLWSESAKHHAHHASAYFDTLRWHSPHDRRTLIEIFAVERQSLESIVLRGREARERDGNNFISRKPLELFEEMLVRSDPRSADADILSLETLESLIISLRANLLVVMDKLRTTDKSPQLSADMTILMNFLSQVTMQINVFRMSPDIGVFRTDFKRRIYWTRLEPGKGWFGRRRYIEKEESRVDSLGFISFLGGRSTKDGISSSLFLSDHLWPADADSAASWYHLNPRIYDILKRREAAVESPRDFIKIEKRFQLGTEGIDRMTELIGFHPELIRRPTCGGALSALSQLSTARVEGRAFPFVSTTQEYQFTVFGKP